MKNKILKTITVIVAFVALLCVVCIDSEYSLLAETGLVLSVIWILAFIFINYDVLFKDFI